MLTHTDVRNFPVRWGYKYLVLFSGVELRLANELAYMMGMWLHCPTGVTHENLAVVAE